MNRKCITGISLIQFRYLTVEKELAMFKSFVTGAAVGVVVIFTGADNESSKDSTNATGVRANVSDLLSVDIAAPDCMMCWDDV